MSNRNVSFFLSFYFTYQFRSTDILANLMSSFILFSKEAYIVILYGLESMSFVLLCIIIFLYLFLCIKSFEWVWMLIDLMLNTNSYFAREFAFTRLNSWCVVLCILIITLIGYYSRSTILNNARDSDDIYKLISLFLTRIFNVVCKSRMYARPKNRKIILYI